MSTDHIVVWLPFYFSWLTLFSELPKNCTDNPWVIPILVFWIGPVIEHGSCDLWQTQLASSCSGVSQHRGDIWGRWGPMAVSLKCCAVLRCASWLSIWEPEDEVWLPFLLYNDFVFNWFKTCVVLLWSGGVCAEVSLNNTPFKDHQPTRAGMHRPGFHRFW